jgi:hypothetical protein
MPALAVRLAARRTKVFSVARAVVVLPAARSRRARAVPKGAADRRAADRRVVARLAAVPLAVGPQVVAELRAAVVLSVAAVPPVVAPRVVCLTPVAVPLAVVRAVFPLQAVAVVVAAAVE